MQLGNRASGLGPLCRIDRILCVFFFSSRSRHTRCSRDWSSDGALPILARLFLVVESELDRPVTVGLDGLALDHPVGARQHDRDGNDISLGVVNAGLSQFFSD